MRAYQDPQTGRFFEVVRATIVGWRTEATREDGSPSRPPPELNKARRDRGEAQVLLDSYAMEKGWRLVARI